jgi:putative hemolysin
MSQGDLWSLILGLIFLTFSAFFSSTEAAFLSLQKTRIAHLVSARFPGAQRIARMIESPERLLSTILLGNNLVNVAFTALVTALIVELLGQGVGIIVATAVATVLVLILGEIIPKTIAVRRAERVAFTFARPLTWIETLMWPLVVVLQLITHRMSAIVGGDAIGRSITEAELRAMIDIGEAEGTFEPIEAEMLGNVFRFGDRQVSEVMTPRMEMVAIEKGATLKEFLSVHAQHDYTRFPVYDEVPDNVVGIISAKDVLRAMAERGISYNSPIADLIRKPLFVPETKRVAALFDEMRRSGERMAVVVDEYGGLDGLVTLKQLIEEVLGPVGEEGEGVEEEYEAIDENTFEVAGGMLIEEANEEMGINLPQGDFDTVAGFVLYVLGRIPEGGEQFDYGNLKIEVTQMKDLKVETVKITKKPVESGVPVEADPGQARRDGAK